MKLYLSKICETNLENNLDHVLKLQIRLAKNIGQLFPKYSSCLLDYDESEKVFQMEIILFIGTFLLPQTEHIYLPFQRGGMKKIDPFSPLRISTVVLHLSHLEFLKYRKRI